MILREWNQQISLNGTNNQISNRQTVSQNQEKSQRHQWAVWSRPKMKRGEIRMKKKSVTQKTQQYDRQLSNECKEAIPQPTERTETKNSQGRLNSQRHLHALGLIWKIERNRQTTKGRRLQPVKPGSSALKQLKKQDQNHKSASESLKHNKP